MKAKISKRASVCWDVETGNETIINRDIEVEVFANHVNGTPGIVFNDGKAYCTDFDHIEMIDETFDFGKTDFYNLIIENDIEPEFFGPFGNWGEMISAAVQHRDDDPDKKDGIYHITIPKGVPISIDTYQGRD